MPTAPRVTIWNEFHHERNNAAVAAIYPDGIHGAIGDALREHGLTDIRVATLDMPQHGLDENTLASTDVLVWWGHKRHDDVDADVVERVRMRVLMGMGLVALHSAHYSRIFKALTGTACTLNWNAEGEKERVWVVAPEHPIAAGLGRCFEIEKEEMYGEPFEVPAPDELVFISWFQRGEVFRSGLTYRRGRGRIFYFRPGHETFPTYHVPAVRRVLANGVRWATPTLLERDPPSNVWRAPIEGSTAISR